MRRRIMTFAALSCLLLLVAISTRAPDHRQLSVAINEVCWAGSSTNHTAEWIELFNTTDSTIDLDGWLLVSSDGAPFIRLEGMLGPHRSSDPTSGYYLLERGSDNSVPGITADLVYQGALTNIGEVLTLSDAHGRIIDTANIVLSEDSDHAWPAGSDERGNPPFASMERIWFQTADAPENWASCITSSGGVGGAARCGTPKGENSVYNLPPIARLAIDPVIPHPGQPAKFSAAGSNDPNDPIETITWQFGDGYVATGFAVSHTYAESGSYLLTLTLIDSKGGETKLQRLVDVAFTTPPVADFSLLLKPDERIPRTASVLTFQDESSDADSGIASWDWQFGDGLSATGRVVTHAYTRPGDYIVGLRIADTQGELGVQTRSIHIASQIPIAVLTISPSSPNEGQPASFDARGSFDPDGVILSYQWDFDGDGLIDSEGSQQTASYTYRTEGAFTPSVTVLDDQSETMTRFSTIRVNAAPVAQFQVSDFEVNELEPVTFTDLSQDSDGSIVQWMWDFGDATTSDEASPHHVYQASGSMTVRLTVTDEGGATDTAIATLTVGNLPPLASITTSHSSLSTGSRFSFDASSSSDPSPNGEIVRYEWSFDDGNSYDVETSTPALSQAFAENGQKSVRVRVTDSQGASSISDPLVITITNRAPSVSRVSWTPSAPSDADEVTFSVQVTDPDGQVTSWSWVLESVVLASSQQLVYSFEDNGSYQITLQVRDNDGGSASPYTFTVPVLNAPPVAAFTAVQGSACSGASSVRFDASTSYDPSPTGRIVHVAWDFGDGTSCPGSAAGCANEDRWRPEHCYSSAGTYIVTLVVIDEHGAITRTEKSILIGE